MNSDEVLEQLFAAQLRLTQLITGSGPHAVAPAQLEALLAQRDKVMAAIDKVNVAVLAGTFHDSEAALSNLRNATTKLEHLTSVADDLAKAIDIAKDVVSVATAILGAT